MGYYTGDYYRGDPFFGALIRGVGRLAKGVLGIGGGATKVIAAPAASTAIVKAIPKISKVAEVGGTLVKKGVGIVKKHPVLSAAGAAGAAGVLGGAVGQRVLGGRGMPGARRHRRMNVTNVKALRRAIRRSAGFAKLAKRVLHFTSPRPPRGRPYFKARKRKRVC